MLPKIATTVQILESGFLRFKVEGKQKFNNGLLPSPLFPHMAFRMQIRIGRRGLHTQLQQLI